MNKKIIFLTALSSVLLLASCGGTTSTFGGELTSTYATIKIDGKDNGTVITPDEVNVSETMHSLESKRFYNTQVLPSTGDVNLLVIPVVIPGYEQFSYAGFDESVSLDDRKEQVREDIEKSFFGESDETGWESVASFYKKSSFGKLNLGGTVTDWFVIEDSALDYENATEITISETYNVVEEAVDWALRTQNINVEDYDSDNDGFIDGVWLVYSAEDYSKNGPMTDDQNYWAYTTWGNQDKYPNADIGEYYYNLFGWASYDFMYEGYGKEKVDAHTFIHETGHFLGLNDYYSDRVMYNPVGKIDMMDANVTDHNSYSKMLLGWTKPYVVTGDATINIEDLTKENNLIVIPSDEAIIDNKSFDPFGEYILVELYTNDGLNYQDSIEQISDDRPLASKEAGVRIYHIDNRKFLVSRNDDDTASIKEYENETIDNNNRLVIPLTNSINPDQNYYNLNLSLDYYPFDEIRMIEANNVNTFSSGGYQTIESLFGIGDVFSMEKYGENFFLNVDKFDNGEHFSSVVSIENITEVE